MVFKPPRFHEELPEIEIENPEHERLESAVARALAIAQGVDASDLTVTATDTGITLSGNLLWPYEVERAVEVAKSVPGVENVNVSIEVAKRAIE
ncbi:BON domain-containing protein [Rhizobium daejeonense]|uniref:BON domain-containing protein n=1 Tax=Rhizobium daejeonense TaxID=240521 RepID=A0A6M1RT76_9HYPH|nr:BON domain-containing protein [Rhizobium daejeonense]NGO64632.1 BON domain-containing protein [Rhizobium daejeonense]